MSNTIASFDTYWKEIGSLQPEIFALPYDQREPFRLVVQAAWQYRDDESEELVESQDNAASVVLNAIEALDELQSEADNLKDYVVELIQKIDTTLTALRRDSNHL